MSKRRLFAGLVALAALAAPRVALADDGDWGVTPQTLPAAPPASAPSGPLCAVNRREGFTDADASAAEQVVCSEIREHGHPGRYRIHLGKLGGKVIVTLVEQIENTTIERQVVLSDLGELTVAAPRLVEANHERKSVDETLNVSNVVGEETRTPKKRSSAVHGWLGFIGAGGGGGTGGGVNIGISAGSERWSFVGDFRLAGEAFNKPAYVAGTIVTLGGLGNYHEGGFSYVSLAGGARYHLLASDISPYVGAGLGIDNIDGSGGDGVGGKSETGLAGYGELGVDFLRTHLVGGAIAFRADMPAFMNEQTKQDPNDPQRYLRRTTYLPVLSAGFAFRF